ncbi:hypothetical protein F5X68DRAFT_56749 [Plectosphaerella plurivora]|uniref:Uncharacterized protein n=1 Tax=Plectosphaerella plurivora TaxID=936078 RepID=A0A9P8VG08_9PEZI|nr:hypothetical protein F5X68DRAFT_56749 [Plectosphaerella plurivora]
MPLQHLFDLTRALSHIAPWQGRATNDGEKAKADAPRARPCPSNGVVSRRPPRGAKSLVAPAERGIAIRRPPSAGLGCLGFVLVISWPRAGQRNSPPAAVLFLWSLLFKFALLPLCPRSALGPASSMPSVRGAGLVSLGRSCRGPAVQHCGSGDRSPVSCHLGHRHRSSPLPRVASLLEPPAPSAPCPVLPRPALPCPPPSPRPTRSVP